MKNYHYLIILKNRNFQGQIPVTQRVKMLKATSASLFFPSLCLLQSVHTPTLTLDRLHHTPHLNNTHTHAHASPFLLLKL